MFCNNVRMLMFLWIICFPDGHFYKVLFCDVRIPDITIQEDQGDNMFLVIMFNYYVLGCFYDDDFMTKIKIQVKRIKETTVTFQQLLQCIDFQVLQVFFHSKCTFLNTIHMNTMHISQVFFHSKY